MTPKPTSYDEVPYQSHPFPQTHPERLASIATLFGLSPPPIERCRVLELGCAAGGNLIPLAFSLPESSCLGVELSAGQAGKGQLAVRELGLSNVEIRHANILDIDASWGKFDYVIVHGVFSWVPRDVQDKILEVCSANLVENGVAYVSYNTYPGWHMYGMLRDMMLFHANRFDEPARKVSEVRGLLDFLDRWVPEENDPYGLLLKKGAEEIRTKSDWYLYHDHLEEINDPVYFHQFVERVSKKGLKFLGEASLAVMSLDSFPAEVQQKVREVAPDALLQEQYTDFLRNRTFRQTLLVHQTAQLSRNLTHGALIRFHLAAGIVPVRSPVDIRTYQREEFRGSGGGNITSNSPLVKAFLVLLGESWPQAVPFSEVYRWAWQQLGQAQPRALAEAIANGDADAIELVRFVFQLLTHGVTELHLSPMRFTSGVSERPKTSPLVLYQTRSGNEVTNLRHESIRVGEFDRQLLSLLDGTRDKNGLIESLGSLVRAGVLTVRENDVVVLDPVKQRRAVAVMLEQNLPLLARRALLVG